MRKVVIAIVMVPVVAVLIGVMLKRHRTQVVAQATARAQKLPPGIGGIVLPPSRPAWKVHGHVEELPEVKVVAQISAQQWAQQMRDEVCACKDVACARAAQHAHLREVGSLNFASGDRAETDRSVHDAAECTGRLLVAASSVAAN